MSELSPSRRRSWPRTAGRIAAVAGAVVCLAVIIAAWFGRSIANNAVDGVSGSVDGAIDRAITATQSVSAQLDSASAEAASIATAANEAASNPGTDGLALTAVSDRLDGFTSAYERLRTAYTDVRENAASALASMDALASFIPGVSVPQEPVDRLAAVDQNIRALDDAVGAIQPTGQQVTAAAQTAAASAIATGATYVQGAIDRAAARVDGLTAELQSVQTSADNAANAVRNVVLIAALAISILFVWVLLLNLSLWRFARAGPA
jgi:hypothetical protein